MKFSEILKAEMDRQAVIEHEQEKVLSGLRLHRRFWEAVATFKAKGKTSMLYEWMMAMNYSSSLGPHPEFFYLVIDENGIQIEGRRDINLNLTYEEILHRVLKNHGVSFEGNELKIPDDLEIPEEVVREESPVIDTPENIKEAHTEIAAPKKDFLSKLKFWK